MEAPEVRVNVAREAVVAVGRKRRFWEVFIVVVVVVDTAQALGRAVPAGRGAVAARLARLAGPARGGGAQARQGGLSAVVEADVAADGVSGGGGRRAGRAASVLCAPRGGGEEEQR